MSTYVYKSSNQRSIPRFFRDLISARELLRDVVSRELRARYRYATLGFLWTLLEPLAMMLVLTFVFTKIFPQGRIEGLDGEKPDHFAVVLLCGLIFWQYLSNSLTAATQSLISNQNLVTKVNFTREVIPIAAVVVPLVNLGIGFLLLLGVHALLGGDFGWAMLWFPFLFAIQFALVLGLGLILACGQVLFRDVGHLIGVALTFGFYATPVFYQLEQVRNIQSIPAILKTLYMLNPMAGLITAYRQVLFDLRFPDLDLLVWPTVSACIILCVGVVFFRRKAPTLSDHL